MGAEYKPVRNTSPHPEPRRFTAGQRQALALHKKDPCLRGTGGPSVCGSIFFYLIYISIYVYQY